MLTSELLRGSKSSSSPVVVNPVEYVMQCSINLFSGIPIFWPLVPLRGKRPYDKGWLERYYDHAHIAADLDSGRATGFGLRLGAGLLAIDFDGESAWSLLAKLSRGKDLSIFRRTVSFTSGRFGRQQCLLSVPEIYWGRLKKLIKIATGVIDSDGNSEFLEFRYSGTQSVLPPSLHPITAKPYEWINSPDNIPVLPAPEWLLDLCENYHSEYGGFQEIDFVRFPARLFSHFGPQMGVWLLARRFDVSREKHRGRSMGCGIGKFTLKAAAVILGRKQNTIRRILSDAKKSGLIRHYRFSVATGWVKVFYTSLQKAIALARLDSLGPVASIPIDSLKNLRTLSTEIESQALQRSSFYRQRQEDDPQNRPPIIEASALLTSDKLAGVLGKSRRFIFCVPSFRFYGGSQKSVAQFRGVSPRTVTRHLSNCYRLSPSPVRSFRDDLPPIVKKQFAELVPGLDIFPSKICRDEGLINMGGDWFRPRCNIYLLSHRLASVRCRRQYLAITPDSPGDGDGYKLNLCFEKIWQAGIDNNYCLYFVNGVKTTEEKFNISLNNSREDNSCTFVERPLERRARLKNNQDKTRQN